LTLFPKLKNREHAGELIDSTLGFLIGGEIARNVAKESRFVRSEQAFICAMFRHLGRHLVHYYLFADYQRVQAEMAARGLGEQAGSRAVLGISFEELGVSVAKRWRMSNQVLNAMRAMGPGPIRKPHSDEERLRVFAGFSNDLAETFANEVGPQYEQSLSRIVERYGRAIPVPKKRIGEIVTESVSAVQKQYTGVFDFDLKQSKLFSRALPDGRRIHTVGAVPHAPNARRDKLAESVLLRARSQERNAVLDLVTKAVGESQRLDRVLSLIVGAYHEIGFSRVLLFIPSTDRKELELRAGRGPGVDGLVRSLKMPISAEADDILVSTFRDQRDLVLDDLTEPTVSRRLPEWVFDGQRPKAAVLLSVVVFMKPVALFYCDGEASKRAELHWLTRMRDQASIAFRRARQK